MKLREIPGKIIRALLYALLLIAGLILGGFLLLSLLFPKEMNAVMTVQSAGSCMDSGEAIAARLGLEAMGGPIGWFLIVITLFSLVISGQNVAKVQGDLLGPGGHPTGTRRTWLLILQAIPILWPVYMVLFVFVDLCTMNLFNIPKSIINPIFAGFSAIAELLFHQRSPYL